MSAIFTRFSQMVLCGVLLLGGAATGAAGQQSPAAAPARSAAPRPAAPGAQKAEDKLNALLTQRLELLRQIEQFSRERQKQGLATFVDVQRAVIAVVQADLDREHTRAERIALRQKWVEAARGIESAAESDRESGSGDAEALIQARLARIEAEIALEREKRGLLARR